jgi:predicted lysophospholipase L1 biosynthesis ABC-type transport system permease subunit
MGGEPWVIAGVIDDVRNTSLDAEPRAQAYVDFIAMDDIGRESGWGGFAPAAGTISFAARVAGEPLQVVGAIRGLVRQLDPAVTIDGVAAMDSITSSALAGPRFQAVLPSLFAAVAGIVAALGIYGVLSHAVDLRRREFGIRMALGAAPGRVQRMVLREAGVLTAIGVAAGIGGAVALTRFLRAMLFGVTPLDPATFVLVPLGFGLVAMLAALVPSRRATRVDPATVLRQE